MLVAMLKETKAPTVSQFLTHSFSRVSPAVAQGVLRRGGEGEHAASARKCGRHEADRLYQAIQKTKIGAPATNYIAPIGEELILRGLHRWCRASSTPPPAAPGGLSRQSLPHRGRPRAYGGGVMGQGREALHELLEACDARTCGSSSRPPSTASAPRPRTRFCRRRACHRRSSPGKLKTAEIAKLHEAMRNVNLHDGQSMTLLRYANRVPLQFPKPTDLRIAEA